jgi:predicted lipid-binding transport protein (Tim44 family)
VIDGDPETVVEVKDVWTFARDTRSRDPNWKLVATEAEE